ncbi:F-box/WD repeat-containing protein 5 [Ciona intestinalis]
MAEQQILNHDAFNSWEYLPEELLLKIFQYVDCKHLLRLGQTCRCWKLVADQELLWKRRFATDFKLDDHVSLYSGAISWKEEYERLIDRVPSAELEKIEEHTDEVLHVAFANNGMMFSTCSKDAYIKVYNADWPFETVFSEYLGVKNLLFQWKYTQLSQFSPCDTQLLVSGRCTGSEQGGEIVVYNIFAGSFTIQSRVRILPYDVMGTWLNDSHILSAKAHVLSYTRQCLCEVVLNKSSQEVENLHKATMSRAFLFKCNNYATVSYIRVADLTSCIRKIMRSDPDVDLSQHLHAMHFQHLKNINERKIYGQCNGCKQTLKRCIHNENEQAKLPRTTWNKEPTCFSFCSKPVKYVDGEIGVVLKSCGIQSTDTESLPEKNNEFCPESSDTCYFQNQSLCPLCGQERSYMSGTDGSSASTTSAEEDHVRILLPKVCKVLIGFTGDYVSIPHQIGIKYLKEEECGHVDERDLKSLIAAQDYNRSDLQPDNWDHIIEVKGHCVGMTLSSCNRYLYVNVREWLTEDDISPFNPPPIANDIKMFVYDLITMTKISVLSGHNAKSDVFFLHLSSNDLYVASGSEDNCGYIWDRHYGVCVSQLVHDDVVNCVAVNPCDPSMAVSASDDKTIKIWRSKSFRRLLSGVRAKARTKL